jgi:ubiquinone/menaquinone biosynthesis C-methylase UbiE
LSAELNCAGCERKYPFREGIPDFSSREHYWNLLTEERMDVLLDIARDRGYKYAVEKILGAFADPYLVGYVLDDGRADFRALLPLTRDSAVLDLGSGWGAVACGLAASCGTVTALDTNPRSLEFIRLRAEQSGLTNVNVAQIDPLDDAHLPFADNTFDVAMLNGVLEYVGEASRDSSPEEVQRRCLEEIRRVVKPGGVLYVGIENRYGLLYFLGTRDHSSLRYTSLLPRPIANLIMQIRLRRPYRTYTYSEAGYRNLLKSAGFDEPSMYLAYPTYREPHFILPSNNDRALTYFVRRHASHIRSRIQRAVVNGVFRLLPPRLSCRLMVKVFYCYMLVAENRG